MGCASSNPLIDGGKNLMDSAKDTASDMMHKGEDAIHDATETAKDGLEHVKEAMESAMNTAENSIGTMVGKISGTMNGTEEQLNDAVKTADETAHETVASTTEAVNEAISEAETVMAAEEAAVAESALAEMTEARDELGETVEPIVKAMEETLHVEDVEEVSSPPVAVADETPPDAPAAASSAAAAGGEDDDGSPQQQQEAASTSNSDGEPSPDPEPEPAPTPWEAAADLILKLASARPSIDLSTNADLVQEFESADLQADGLSAAIDGDDAQVEVVEIDAQSQPPPRESGRWYNVTRTCQRVHQGLARQSGMDGVDLEAYNKELDEYIDKDYDLPANQNLLIDTLSIKSYKSEI